MKIKDLIEKLMTFTDEERTRYLPKLMDGFCSVSQNQITNFQTNWDDSKDYKEFVKAQNKELITCLKMEMSPLGDTVRAVQTLPFWNEETDIEEYVK